MLDITVIGTPAPQGSKNHFGKGRLVESSKKVKPWREAVVWAARQVLHERDRISGPVGVDIVFTVAKPKSAPKKRKTWPDRKPDLDKLIRSTADALVTAGAIDDDARIICLSAQKVYPNECLGALDVPGAYISIRPIGDVPR